MSADKNLDIKTLTKTLPWRDHWMQAVYFLTKEISVNQNDSFVLYSNHDEFSFWFEVGHLNGQPTEVYSSNCNCTFHFVLSRSRIGGINDNVRRNLYYNTLQSVIKKDTVCIILGSISLLGHLCAKLGARKVYILNNDLFVDKFYQMISVQNNLVDKISVTSSESKLVNCISKDLNDDECFDILILSEPYYRNSILPWDNMEFWYTKENIINLLRDSKQVKSINTIPIKFKLKGCAVQFDNLWKIAAPLNKCEGFSMTEFDRLIAFSKKKAISYVEAQPLWEYPGIALSHPITFFEYNLNYDVVKEKVKNMGKIQIEYGGRCDGIALWMEYDLTESNSLSFGPTQRICPGQYVEWDMFERQGVHLFTTQSVVKENDCINYDAEFDPDEAEVNFNFDFNTELV